MSVVDTVIKIVAEQAFLDVSDVTENTTLQEVGIDSMGIVECIFSIEEAFDIQVPFNANDPAASQFDISSIQSISAAVEGLIKDQKG